MKAAAVWVKAHRCRPGIWLLGTAFLFLLLGSFSAIGRSTGSARADSGRPTWGSPIAVAPGGAIWTVNPDAGSVAVVDAGLKQVAEVAMGGEPWAIAIAPDGATAYALDRAGGRLVPIDTATRAIGAPIRVGPEPGTVVVNPSGTRAYVSLTADDRIAVIDTRSLTVTDRLPVDPRPYALAGLPGEGGADRLIVPHFQALPRPGGAEAEDDGREGRVTILDIGSHVVTASIALPPDARGFPNLLAGVAVSGQRAWIAHTRAAPDLPNDFKTTVFAAVAVVDLARLQTDSAESIPLNNEDIFGAAVNNPVAAVPSPDGSRLYVVPAGSDVIEVIDVRDPRRPALIGFLPAGRNPRGIAISPDGRRGYVMSYLSRSVTVLDLEKLDLVAEVPVARETLDPAVLRGKILFNQAVDPRLTKRGWISCASCHPDGGADGVTWRFPDGPRQSTPLWNAAETLPWHWSAALDEAQDVEDTIQTIQHGLGLAPGAEPPLLGRPIAGRSADLDALAAYLEHGIRPVVPPSPEGDVNRGRQVFRAAGCPGCHAGPTWTISARPGAPGTLDPDGNGMVDAVLRDVGTFNPLDSRGATGYDVPSLIGAGLTAPYLHDGSQPTIEALIASGHPRPPAQRPPAVGPIPNPSRLFLPAVAGRPEISPDDRAALAAFVRSIGQETAAAGNPQPERRGLVSPTAECLAADCRVP